MAVAADCGTPNNWSGGVSFGFSLTLTTALTAAAVPFFLSPSPVASSLYSLTAQLLCQLAMSDDVPSAKRSKTQEEANGGGGGGGGRAHNNRARPSKDSSRDAGLSYLVDSTIEVVTNDGRVIVGVLRGYDQVMNIILDESHERVYSAKQGVECVVLGLQVIRGDNIALVGEVDVERDTAIDLAKVHAKPLNVVVH